MVATNLLSFFSIFTAEIPELAYHRKNDEVNQPGLFTSRDCCSGEAAAYEAVVNYSEWAATKPMR